MSSPAPSFPRPVPPAPTAPAAPSGGASPARSVRGTLPVRAYHSAVSLVVAALVFTGFHLFYTQGRAYPGREIDPSMLGVVVTHGVSMTLWLVLSVVEPLLGPLQLMVYGGIPPPKVRSIDPGASQMPLFGVAVMKRPFGLLLIVTWATSLQLPFSTTML